MFMLNWYVVKNVNANYEYIGLIVVSYQLDHGLCIIVG